jgi:predicted TIM-barrel fold metal-dependent hydrolase
MTMRIGRREFLSGVAAAGAVAFAPDILTAGQGSSSSSGGGTPRRIIDTHYHYASPKYRAMLRARNTGQTGLYDWDEKKALEDMDRYGVSTSMLSISEPGTHFGDDAAARALARECNEYAAKLVADHPGRFGLLAILPLPDVDGSLKEIEYAYDTLKADGICFMSSYPYPGKYQGNKYLGDPMFVPVMQELNRRNAVCYTHPFRAEALYNVLPDHKATGITLATETTITILSILENETATRFPDIRFIWSHGGGTMPYITGRLGIAVGPDGKPNARMETIKRFYYDTAQLVMPWTLDAFTKLIPNSQVTFGSDYLGNPGPAGNVAKGLEAYGGFTPAQLRAIYRENALALFPRLKQA